MHHTAIRPAARRDESQPHSHVILNKVMKLLLQSPFHGIVSRRIMLITFTGRMSGKSFTTPVTYVRDGDMVRVFSNQRWWRNLAGGHSIDCTFVESRFPVSQNQSRIAPPYSLKSNSFWDERVSSALS